MKNKNGLSFKLAFFALIAFSILIIAVGTWINEWNEDYSSGLTYDLGGLDKLDEVSEEAESQQSGISIKSTNTGEEFEGTSIRGVFGDGGMLDNVTERFGIPDYLRQALVAMMVIGITFTLVGIFFRLNRRNV